MEKTQHSKSGKTLIRSDPNNDLKQIDKLLDNSIRPYLHRDGGDVELLYFDGKKLYMQFTGACRECRYAPTSTFTAIQEVVERYDDEIELINAT